MTLSALLLRDRRVRSTGAGLLVSLGLCAGTGAAQSLSATRGLTALLPAGVAAAVTGRSDGSVALSSPPGTPVSAPIDATATADGADLRLDGVGDDAGVTLVVSGLARVTAAGSVHRGDPLGTAGAAPLTVALMVGGHRVDAAPLVEAGLDGDAAVAAAVRPVLGAVVSQGFGCTAYGREPVDPLCPGGHFHSGIDLAAPPGTPVQAMLGGSVTVMLSDTGYGLHVLIDHGGGLVSLYGHLDSVAVATGDVIETGGVLGAVGSTGNSSGPHLHFEIRRGGVAVDPSTEVSLP